MLANPTARLSRPAGTQLELSCGYMCGSIKEIRTVQQRLALLKQQERELRSLYSQSHASLVNTEEIETKLVAVAEEIVELESEISPER